MARLVIFTDLDGTLLHPKTYSFNAALPALKLIKEKEIPLILCSSKTKAEIEEWRKRIGNHHPFVSENGGGIFVPEKYFSFSLEEPGSKFPLSHYPHPIPPPSRGRESKSGGEGENYKCILLGKPYIEIRKAFIAIRERLGIKTTGFGDMTVKEIAALAGLTLTEAKLAKQREFDEPFIFEEGEARIQEFLKAIEDAGFHWTQGRFFHIMGDNDKGKAVRLLKGFYEKKFGKIKTIGLGNNLNDMPFLKEVDVPVLVKNEDNTYDERVHLPNLIKANGIGPEGWNKEVLKLI